MKKIVPYLTPILLLATLAMLVYNHNVSNQDMFQQGLEVGKAQMSVSCTQAILEDATVKQQTIKSPLNFK